MPPRPLQNLSSAHAYADDSRLTPRTPHSRAGRAEEAFTDVELEQFGDDEHRDYTVSQQQQEPLLASSASNSFPITGYRARGDDDALARPDSLPTRIAKWLVARAGLALGSLLAVALFLLIIVSYKRPEVLLKAIGDLNATSASSPMPSQPIQGVSLASQDIISYENYTKFPLDPMEYRAECHKLTGDRMKPMPYWSDHMHQDVIHHDTVNPGKYSPPEGERTQICSKTITYMLDGHVGLLADLAIMAQVAALARERNRTFWVDDTYWNRGKWTDHFQDVRARQPGPEPGCRAPPPEELVACPRTARHWVVNSRTAKYHLGHGYHDQYDDAYGHYLNRFKPIYVRADESLRNTIRPNAANAALIRSARHELASRIPDASKAFGATIPDPPSDHGKYIGVHIRRGDGFGQSWKYHKKYVPIEDYSDAITSSWSRLFTSPSYPPKPIVYVASDAPTSLAELRPLLPSDSILWSLRDSENADLRDLASPAPYVQADFNEFELEDRIKQTRGMIVDFAILSGFWAWDDDVTPAAVVCTIGSNVCKLSAVGLGWDRAFGYGFDDNTKGDIDRAHMRWVEIDEKGAIEPAWDAYRMFN
ncbi:hypothetical protein FA95DRAFT_1536124 [Auriscalpium vulgare]|uniref:Uncharacterized protein n=1 Tax=Auriscalpium vulgare TaxID=40419 RepID=A0ACB8S3D5_9AGAM|nr:hypothetical protein FA95DRAFT_1536124 [Auriscalpium vulgare]